MNGAFVMKVIVESPPATAHTSVWSRRTGTPSSSARSSFSAAARTARPASVRRRNHPRPMSTTGAAASIRTWSPRIGYGRTNQLPLSGVSMFPISASVPSISPMIRPIAPRICASPIDATVNTSRDERAKRRMTSTSTAAPVATPTATPTAIACQ